MRSSLTVQAEAQQVSQPPVPTGSLAVMQKHYACRRTVPIRMVQAIARERYGRFRRRSLLPGRQARESMAVPARVSASVRGRFAFRYRNHRHPPQFEWWVTDGFRIRVECDGDRVRLITRGGYDWTKRYPWIAGNKLPQSNVKQRNTVLPSGHRFYFDGRRR